MYSMVVRTIYGTLLVPTSKIVIVYAQPSILCPTIKESQLNLRQMDGEQIKMQSTTAGAH